MIDKVKQGRANRRKGYNFEDRVRKLYQKWGWYVQRNTWGLFDLVCIPPRLTNFDAPVHFRSRSPHLVQPQTPKYIRVEKRQALIDASNRWNGDAFVITREPKAPFALNFIPVEELEV